MLFRSGGTAAAAAVPLTFEKAKAIYEQSKDKAEFQQYWREFSTWDEAFDVDLRSKHGCLSAKGPKSIEVLLVISADGVIESVLSKEDSPKAVCLRSMYAGLKVRPPPFSPTVLEFEANDYLTRMMIEIIN